jgi:hypothetical protein
MATIDSQNHTVTLEQARKAMKKVFKIKRPIFVWGQPGVGKSDMVRSLATELGGVAVDVRLAQCDPTDIRGIPYFNKDTNTMQWAPADMLPSHEFCKDKPIVVLFLDELNSAPSSVQAAAYQLILDRCVGKYVLPDNVVIVAAGNRDGDKGVTYRMPSPLANRFIHIEVHVDFESWQTWAVKNEVHPDVVGYLSWAKQNLSTFDPKSASRSFATPRSWQFVSDMLKDDDCDDETLFTLIAGSVGDGLASAFRGHRKFANQLPKPEDILSGKVKELKLKEISAMYALTTGMCYELKAQSDKKLPAKEFDAMTDNFFRFMIDNFETELAVMGGRMALNVYDLPINISLKSLDEYTDKFGKYLAN